MSAVDAFAALDRNRDGVLSREEFSAAFGAQASGMVGGPFPGAPIMEPVAFGGAQPAFSYGTMPVPVPQVFTQPAPVSMAAVPSYGPPTTVTAPPVYISAPPPQPQPPMMMTAPMMEPSTIAGPPVQVMSYQAASQIQSQQVQNMPSYAPPTTVTAPPVYISAQAPPPPQPELVAGPMGVFMQEPVAMGGPQWAQTAAAPVFMTAPAGQPGMFEALDRNNDGVLSREEFAAAQLGSVGSVPQVMSYGAPPPMVIPADPNAPVLTAPPVYVTAQPAPAPMSVVQGGSVQHFAPTGSVGAPIFMTAPAPEEFGGAVPLGSVGSIPQVMPYGMPPQEPFMMGPPQMQMQMAPPPQVIPADPNAPVLTAPPVYVTPQSGPAPTMVLQQEPQVGSMASVPPMVSYGVPPQMPPQFIPADPNAPVLQAPPVYVSAQPPPPQNFMQEPVTTGPPQVAFTGPPQAVPSYGPPTTVTAPPVYLTQPAPMPFTQPQTMFDALDRNNDGVLSREEFAAAAAPQVSVRSLPPVYMTMPPTTITHAAPPMPPPQSMMVQEPIAGAPMPCQAVPSYGPPTTVTAPPVYIAGPPQPQTMFEALDRNRDGVLSREEFAAMAGSVASIGQVGTAPALGSVGTLPQGITYAAPPQAQIIPADPNAVRTAAPVYVNPQAPQQMQQVQAPPTVTATAPPIFLTQPAPFVQEPGAAPPMTYAVPQTMGMQQMPVMEPVTGTMYPPQTIPPTVVGQRQDLFATLDRNNDGVLSREEFAAMGGRQ